MKKYHNILVCVMVLLMCCNVNAGSNPFIDVPEKHWAYEALMQLAKNGIVEGESLERFNGGKALTRYEMAMAVVRALTYSGNISSNDKALLGKLTVEFAAELKNLNVKLDVLEEKMNNAPQFSADITWQAGTFDTKNQQWSQAFANASTTGAAYIGEYGVFSGIGQGVNGKDNYDYMRLRLLLGGAVDDRWTYEARMLGYSDFNRGYLNATPGNNMINGLFSARDYSNVLLFEYGYLKGDYDKWKIFLGKLDTTLPYSAAQPDDDGGFGINQAAGLINDSYMVGVRLAFAPSETWRFNMYYGSEEAAPALDVTTGVFTSAAMASPYINTMLSANGDGAINLATNIMGLDLGYSASDKLNVYLSWMQMLAGSAGWGNVEKIAANNIYNAESGYATDISANQLWNQRSMNFWQTGLDYKLSNRLLFSGFFGGSKARIDNKAWVARLDYTPGDGYVVDTTTAGSYSLYAYYQYLERYSAWMPTYDVISINGLGAKGWTLGAYYVFVPNTSLNLEYAFLHSANSSLAAGAFADIMGGYGTVEKWYAAIDYYF